MSWIRTNAISIYLRFFGNIEGQDQFAASFHDGVETIPGEGAPD
jgi:hypothetical protein